MIQLKLDYIQAILNDINRDFQKTFVLKYAKNLKYTIECDLKKKQYFFWDINEVQKFVEVLRDMYYNKDWIYFMKSMLEIRNDDDKNFIKNFY